MTRSRTRQDWTRVVADVATRHPITADSNWTPETTAALLSNDDMLAAILRDLIRVGASPVQRGARVMPDFDTGMARLSELRNGGCTVEPFQQALTALAGGRSRRHLATKTGLSATKIHRLITGDVEPTLDEMTTIAAAFKRPPWYFTEARAALIAQAVARYLAANPEQSVPLAKRLTGAA